MAFPIVHRLEGGRVNDPHDPGGLTLGGVTQPAYDEWRDREGKPRQSVGLITPGEIEGVYQMFWVDIKAESIETAGGADIALIVFDAAINQGRGYAPKLLQWAIGVAQDGQIGPMTLMALSHQDRGVLARRLIWGRMGRYVATVRDWRKAHKEDPARFLAGWYERLYTLWRLVDPAVGASPVSG